jgi:hypothetical protein
MRNFKENVRYCLTGFRRQSLRSEPERMGIVQPKLTRRMPYSGMLRRVGFVRTDVLEQRSASIIRVTRIRELGTTLAVTSNRRKLRRNTKVATYRGQEDRGTKFLRNVGSYTGHGATYQKKFFIVPAVITSSPTYH